MGALTIPFLQTPTTEESPVVGQGSRTGSVAGLQISNGATTGTILLPRDFNPVAMLQACESLRSFLDKTLHQGKGDEALKFRQTEPARTPYSECASDSGRKQDGTRFKLQVVVAKRSKEMQVKHRGNQSRANYGMISIYQSFV